MCIEVNRNINTLFKNCWYAICVLRFPSIQTTNSISVCKVTKIFRSASDPVSSWHITSGNLSSDVFTNIWSKFNAHWRQADLRLIWNWTSAKTQLALSLSFSLALKKTNKCSGTDNVGTYFSTLKNLNGIKETMEPFLSAVHQVCPLNENSSLLHRGYMLN